MLNTSAKCNRNENIGHISTQIYINIVKPYFLHIFWNELKRKEMIYVIWKFNVF